MWNKMWIFKIFLHDKSQQIYLQCDFINLRNMFLSTHYVQRSGLRTVESQWCVRCSPVLRKFLMRLGIDEGSGNLHRWMNSLINKPDCGGARVQSNLERKGWNSIFLKCQVVGWVTVTVSFLEVCMWASPGSHSRYDWPQTIHFPISSHVFYIQQPN